MRCDALSPRPAPQTLNSSASDPTILPFSFQKRARPRRRSTLLCDTVREAQHLAFMGPERHKVVAMDGTLFSKGGCITGGRTGNEQNRAARFDEQDTAALKQVRTRVAFTRSCV